jgi:hypothetical protein
MKSRKSLNRPAPPPPVLAGSKVIAYAILDTSIPYAGRGKLFTDGKPLGRVPRLALTHSRGEAAVLYCTRAWRVLAGFLYESVVDARGDAERIYPGVSRKWRRVRVTERQAERYLRQLWKGLECSFCGRRPDQIEKMVSRGRRVRICDVCVREIGEVMSAD